MVIWLNKIIQKHWFRAILFSFIYYFTAVLSNEISFLGASFPTLWLPGGFFLAVLLLTEIIYWPAYLLAALPASLIFSLSHGQSLPLGALLYITSIIEVSAGAWLIRRYDPQYGKFENPANVLYLISFSVFACNALIATINTTVLAVLQGSVAFWAVWRIIWISHALGILVITPLVLSWASVSLKHVRKINPERLIELAILILGLLVCSLYLFVSNFHLNRLSYLAVPFLVWVAIRFGPRMVSLCGAIVTFVAIWGTAQQLLGFATNDLTIAPNMDSLGIFLIVTLITVYILATVWQQSKHIEDALRNSESRYRKLIQNQGEGVAIVDHNEVFTFSNPAANQIFGTDDLTGKSLREFTNPAQFAAIQQQTELRKAGQKSSYELEIFQPSGKRCDLWITATPEYDNNGEYNGTFAVFRDITERKQVEMALRDSRARFQTLFDHSPVPIWEEDFSRIKRFTNGLQRDGIVDFREFYSQHPEQVAVAEQLIRVLDVNQAAIQMLGFTDKNQFLNQMHKLVHRGPNDVFVEELCAIAEGKTDFEVEGPNDLVDGVIRYHHVHWTVAPGYEQDYRRVIVTIMDVTERKQVEERMRYLSTHDVLTGLYNRNLFEAELERMQDSRLEPINVMVVDVNGMKTTNDTFGHSAGDELLRRTAQVLKTSFRKEDIIARIGGDEFVVLFQGSITAQDAVNRVKDCLNDHNHWYEGSPLSLAIGAASGTRGSSLVELYKKADYLMYRDKSRARKARPDTKSDA